jgi:hypothetical protein
MVGGRSVAISVGTGEGGAVVSVVEVGGSMVLVLRVRVRLGRFGGGVTGVVVVEAPDGDGDDGPAVGSESSSWRRFRSGGEEPEGVNGEERGVLALMVSDVVASVITTSSSEGPEGEARLNVFRARRNGMIRALFVTSMSSVIVVVEKSDKSEGGGALFFFDQW